MKTTIEPIDVIKDKQGDFSITIKSFPPEYINKKEFKMNAFKWVKHFLIIPLLTMLLAMLFIFCINGLKFTNNAEYLLLLVFSLSIIINSGYLIYKLMNF